MPTSLGPFLRTITASLVPLSVRVSAIRREFAAERTTIERAASLYRTLVPPNGLVFDVGANVGRRVQLFLSIPARVVAIEPQPRCAEILRRLFANHPAVSLEASALGAAPGEALLRIADVDTLSSMDEGFIEATSRSGRFAAHRWRRPVTVPVQSLDLLIARHGEPDFVKIDVEGYELEVLKGLHRPLRALSVEFVPELWQRAVACMRLVERFGPIEANLSLGESHRWEFDQWLQPDDMEKVLAGYADRVDLFGDLYCRSLPSPTP